jgi:hypothetical protein
MRRFLLTLTLVSFSASAQPAPQHAQPPTVVKVEMPPANPWMRLVELVIPGVIGAGLALFGVWLTNKNNAATNAANRQHEFHIERMKAETAARYKSLDNNWAFRKDVYINLIKATIKLESAIHEVGRQVTTYHELSTATPVHTFNLETARQRLYEATKRLCSLQDAFTITAYLAPIATADDVLPLIEEMKQGFSPDNVANLKTIESTAIWTRERSDKLDVLCIRQTIYRVDRGGDGRYRFAAAHAMGVSSASR